MLGKRSHGGSIFLDVVDQSGKIQGLVKRDRIGDDRYRLLDATDIGDIVALTGPVEKTRTGEHTVSVNSWALLTKARTPLPDTWAGLQDHETRARTRELDLIANASARLVLEIRSRVLSLLRRFFSERGFLEVETPTLQPIPGGATARPFTTHHNALDLDLFLRISPELYLKRLVVGGIERVFEVSRNFRNEGVDRQHNPEFTMCECYLAYARVDDLIPLTEELFRSFLGEIRGGLTIVYRGRQLDFTPPWPQIQFVAALKERTGIDVLHEKDPAVYRKVLERLGSSSPAARNLPALIDALYKETVRKEAWNPVLVRDFPVSLEPLAKRVEGSPALVQRVQLLVAGMELLKAYTELNDPVDQEQRFREQESLRAQGDFEAQRIDTVFLDALRIGLPPTAGWGLGVDRLTMILADQAHIRDVIAFPLFRPSRTT